ncbi:Smr/MutS family protein [Oligella ureolytica]
MHNAGWIQKVKSNLKGSLQDLKKLSKQLSKEQANQKKAEAAAIKQRQRIEAAVTDEDRKVFLASIRGSQAFKKE